MIAETEEFGRSPVAEWAFSMAKKAEAGKINACGFTELFNTRVIDAESSLIPWTHHGYHWVNYRAFLEPTNNTSIQNGVLDTLFAILVLLLILFLQIPRRKVVAKVE